MTATQEILTGLIRDMHNGKVQIPEFQRTMKLTDDWIKSLLASVSLSYPIGAVTLLRTGNADMRFGTHPVPGAPPCATEAERLLIDGQQRMTALYQVLTSGQVTTGHKKRWYYLDMDAALDPDTDRDEAVMSTPDPSGARAEWFPLRLIFAADAELRHWRQGFIEQGVAGSIGRFETTILRAFKQYVIPTIVLGEETTRWTVRVHGGPDGPNLSDRFRVTST